MQTHVIAIPGWSPTGFGAAAGHVRPRSHPGRNYRRGVHTRVTGIMIEDDRILLLDQDTGGSRRWSLPGGKVEDGEILAQAPVREMRE